MIESLKNFRNELLKGLIVAYGSNIWIVLHLDVSIKLEVNDKIVYEVFLSLQHSEFPRYTENFSSECDELDSGYLNALLDDVSERLNN